MSLTMPSFPVVNADPAGEDSLDPPKPMRKRLGQLKRYVEGF
jgi:hypothetical protein